MPRGPVGPGPSLASATSRPFPLLKEGKRGHIVKVTFPVTLLHSPLLSPPPVLSAQHNCQTQPWNTVF